jgi:hypothetical protein
MFNIRRVVTGRGVDGVGSVTADGVPPRTHYYEHIPGHVTSIMWATCIDDDGVGGDPTIGLRNVIPLAGGTTMGISTQPPDSVVTALSFDAEAGLREQMEHLPGIAGQRHRGDEVAATMGMHSTPTVDYIILLEGELWLELEDGSETCLCRGDVVVQNGTAHAWRNRSEAPATYAWVLIGSG